MFFFRCNRRFGRNRWQTRLSLSAAPWQTCIWSMLYLFTAIREFEVSTRAERFRQTTAATNVTNPVTGSKTALKIPARGRTTSSHVRRVRKWQESPGLWGTILEMRIKNRSTLKRRSGTCRRTWFAPFARGSSRTQWWFLVVGAPFATNVFEQLCWSLRTTNVQTARRRGLRRVCSFLTGSSEMLLPRSTQSPAVFCREIIKVSEGEMFETFLAKLESFQKQMRRSWRKKPMNRLKMLKRINSLRLSFSSGLKKLMRKKSLRRQKKNPWNVKTEEIKVKSVGDLPLSVSWSFFIQIQSRMKTTTTTSPWQFRQPTSRVAVQPSGSRDFAGSLRTARNNIRMLRRPSRRKAKAMRRKAIRRADPTGTVSGRANRTTSSRKEFHRSPLARTRICTTLPRWITSISSRRFTILEWCRKCLSTRCIRKLLITRSSNHIIPKIKWGSMQILFTSYQSDWFFLSRPVRFDHQGNYPHQMRHHMPQSQMMRPMHDNYGMRHQRPMNHLAHAVTHNIQQRYGTG